MSELILGVAKSISNPLVFYEQGIFYHAYGGDAKILASVTGYKLVKSKWLKKKTVRCGFPMEAQDKVEDELKRKNIPFRYMVKSLAGKWMPENGDESDDIQDATDPTGSANGSSSDVTKTTPNVLTIKCV